MGEIDEHIAHVINPDGVAETRFVRGERGYSNAEEIRILPGGVLDLGSGLTIKNGERITFTYDIEWTTD